MKFFPLNCVVNRAGNGTSGAKGGQGGTIQIHVDEDKTHLLLGVDWDVKGGKGGSPGKNGVPGVGGKGGSGGQAISWFVCEFSEKGLGANTFKEGTERMEIQLHEELLWTTRRRI